MENIVFILGGLMVGLTLGYVVFVAMRKTQLEKDKQSIIEEAKLQGENIKKDRILEAKEKYIQLRSDYEQETNRRSNELGNSENRIKQKEQSLDDKIRANNSKEEEMAKTRERLDAQIEAYKLKERDVQQLREQQLLQLEKVAGLSAADAKTQMLENIKVQSHTEGLTLAKIIVEEAKLSATREAKRIVLQTIQRTAAETAIDNTVTSFPLENDDAKGRIIGREGRNIKAFEAATGVEILIDDTPETIVLSCYDPIRREIARVSLERLIRDGRIHPARIEEVVEKVKKQVEEEVHLVQQVTMSSVDETQLMLIVLGLIDVVMISNLLVMVIIGGWETFVSRLELEKHPDQPEWLSHVNAGVLKVKLATAIIGISSIHLLKTFINASQFETKQLLWQTVIHITFVLSAVAIAFTEQLMKKNKRQRQN